MSKRDTSTQKTGNTTKNQASVFKPLIASSLALALGVSVGYAQITDPSQGLTTNIETEEISPQTTYYVGQNTDHWLSFNESTGHGGFFKIVSKDENTISLQPSKYGSSQYPGGITNANNANVMTIQGKNVRVVAEGGSSYLFKSGKNSGVNAEGGTFNLEFQNVVLVGQSLFAQAYQGGNTNTLKMNGNYGGPGEGTGYALYNKKTLSNSEATNTVLTLSGASVTSNTSGKFQGTFTNGAKIYGSIIIDGTAKAYLQSDFSETTGAFITGNIRYGGNAGTLEFTSTQKGSTAIDGVLYGNGGVFNLNLGLNGAILKTSIWSQGTLNLYTSSTESSGKITINSSSISDAALAEAKDFGYFTQFGGGRNQAVFNQGQLTIGKLSSSTTQEDPTQSNYASITVDQNVNEVEISGKIWNGANGANGASLTILANTYNHTSGNFLNSNGSATFKVDNFTMQGDIQVDGGTFGVTIGGQNFKSGNITNSGTFEFALGDSVRSLKFTSADITNTNAMSFNFSNAQTLTFNAGVISNKKTFTFVQPSSGTTEFVAKGIHTTGNSGTASTSLTLEQADLAVGYIATASVGATNARYSTMINATANNGKSLILSAINLAQDSNSEELALSGVGENIGIINGSGKYVLFAGKSNEKQEVQLNFNHIQDSYGLVLGDIFTYTGTNTLVLKDAGGADTKLDLLGNILSRGNTNIYFENTLWAPTNISDMIPSIYGVANGNQTAVANILKYVNTYGTGKLTTTDGTTNLVVNTSKVDLGNTPAMYQVDSSAGGNVNIAIKGATNIGAGIKYNTNTNQAVNLIFAATTSGNFSTAGQTNVASNKFFDLEFQDGVKLTLQDYEISDLSGNKISFLNKARTALGIDSSLRDLVFATQRASQANSHSGQDYTDTIVITGVAVGTISKLTPGATGGNDTYTFNVTLTKDSIFAGNIDLHGASKSIELTMEQGSKIFAHNNRLVLSKLNLVTGTEHDSTTLLQNSFAQQNTTIDLATDGNDFANIVARDTFNLLAIGSEADSGNTAGLHGNNALFRVYVRPEASTGQLGGQTSDKTGNTGADRVVILSGKGGKQYIQAIYDANTKVSSIAYYGGGTEVDGNIAVATIKTDTGITMEGAKQIQGFDLIETALQNTKTDVTGKVDGGANTDYTTYFLKSVVSTGASPINADTTTSALGLNYDLFLANFNSLNKRMGELRNNDNAQGAWGRIFNGMLTTSYGLETQSIYTTIQAGYDYTFGFEGANNYLGVALSYANSISDSKKMLDYDGVQKGIDNAITHGVEVALYNSYVEDSGWFNDTIFKFSYMMSNLDIAGQTTSYDTNNFGIVFSDEFGYRFKLGDEQEWYIDPQMELGFGYFNQSDLKQVLGEASLDGIQDAIMTLRARVGVNWAYDFKKFTQGKGINASVYLGTYYSYDYINGGDISLTTNLGKNTNLTPLTSTGRFELNLGTNIEVQNNTRIYFDFEKSFGGTITTEYQVNVGVRYSFGENTGYTPFDPNKKSITPLKVSDENAEESKETQESEENTQESTQTTTSEQTSEASKESANSKDNKTEESTEAKSEEKAQ